MGIHRRDTGTTRGRRRALLNTAAVAVLSTVVLGAFPAYSAIADVPNPVETSPAAAVLGDSDPAGTFSEEEIAEVPAITAPPGLDVTQEVTPGPETAIVPGTVVSYTITVSNDTATDLPYALTAYLADVLDDSTWNNDVFGSGSGTLSHSFTATPASELVMDGTVPANSTMLVTYTVTATHSGAGDGVLRGYLGEQDLSVPEVCSSTPVAGWSCIERAVELPRERAVSAPLEYSVTTEQVHGGSLWPGAETRLTFTFHNSGSASATVALEAYLADFLDDASIYSGPNATGGVTGSYNPSSGLLRFSGTLGAGSTATVWNGIRVKTEGFGNANIIVHMGPLNQTAPDSCTPDAGDTNWDCIEHPIVNREVLTKTASPATQTEVVPGTVVEYTLTLKNPGGTEVAVASVDELADVLDDALLNGDPVVTGSSAVTAAYSSTERLISLGGTLGVGETASVTYSVTVTASAAGSGALVYYVGPADGSHADVCSSRVGFGWSCSQHTRVSHIEALKTSTPASGLFVQAGKDVRYELTFTNTGSTDETIGFTDYLADVADDARWNGSYLSSSGGASLVYVEGSNLIEVRGTIKPGETGTVTYGYRVLESGDAAGNGTMLNILMPNGIPRPSSCEPGDDPMILCTVHEVAESFALVKTADPAPGTAVLPGEEITYTVTATGADLALTGVVLTDTLTRVLDSASFVSGSATLVVGSAGAIPVADPTGTDAITLVTEGFALGVGEVATLSYRVSVNEDAWSRTLTNSVVGVADGGLRQESCGPCSTTHVTSSMIQVLKTGESSSGTWVPMDGSAWALFSDDDGVPGAEYTDQRVEPVVPAQTGLFQIVGIPAGSYWLTETQAPTGFALLAEPVRFTIAADGGVTVSTGAADIVTAAVDADTGIGQITVRDVPALAIPEAGGTGTTPYHLAGLALLFLAGVLTLVLRRRDSDEREELVRGDR